MLVGLTANRFFIVASRSKVKQNRFNDPERKLYFIFIMLFNFGRGRGLHLKLIFVYRTCRPVFLQSPMFRLTERSATTKSKRPWERYSAAKQTQEKA